MRASHAALLGLAACLQACFMTNYEVLRSEAGTDVGVDGGMDSGAAFDAASPDTGALADAWLYDPPDAACAADAAEVLQRSCDSSLCPPLLPTAYSCSAACVLPACLPCKPCQHFCDERTAGTCATNCQPERNCVHQCLRTECESICAQRARCELDCTRAEGCDITCEEGSTCTVYCPDSNRCSVACKPGARCTLICGTPGAACDFTECAGPVARCAGAVSCGGLGCPPP